jgi:hypothetical protein
VGGTRVLLIAEKWLAEKSNLDDFFASHFSAVGSVLPGGI